MTNISFYHLQHTTIDEAIPKLLDLTLRSGDRALVRVSSTEQLSGLSSLLWSQDRDSWLPNGYGEDTYAHELPIWLTVDQENPNGASHIFLLDDIEVDNLDQFKRCFFVFDGKDEASVANARLRWKKMKQAGYKLNYWQQNQKGTWIEKVNG